MQRPQARPNPNPPGLDMCNKNKVEEGSAIRDPGSPKLAEVEARVEHAGIYSISML